MSTSSSTRLWLLVGLALAALLAANAHLVYVSIASQPSCVAHVRPGENIAGSGMFGAAQSSCTPLRQRAPP
ncbi:MAG TPA: hypothetical protein VFB02_06580 [Bradyrhizobium sp.]|nr:hypothetical protein [Bradyrhizobium sp.]